MTFADYAARGRNSPWRYLLGFVLAVALSMALGMLLGIALYLGHAWPADLAEQLRRPTHPAVYFGANGLIFALMIGAFAAMAAVLNKKRPKDLVGAWRWGDFGRGFGIWLVVLIAASLLDLALTPSGFRYSADNRTLTLVLAATPGLAVQTFAEEFVFRGYVTQGFFNLTKRPLPAAILSGLLFAAAHIPNGWPQAANALAFGVVLSLIAMRTGGLAFGWGLHLVNNFYGAVVVVSADDVFNGSPGLFTQHTGKLMWTDALVAALALAVLAVVLLRRGRDQTSP